MSLLLLFDNHESPSNETPTEEPTIVEVGPGETHVTSAASDARMTWRLTLKNYRCFADQQPITFEVGSKFIAFVGPNNSGKSSILKMFLELRPIFQSLAPTIGPLVRDILNKKNSSHVFSLHGSVRDPQEIFCDQNSRDLTVTIVPSAVDATSNSALPLTLTLRRDRHWTLACPSPPDVPESAEWNANGVDLSAGGTHVMSLASYADFFNAIASMLYVGPFRNAIDLQPASGAGSYYDLDVGRAFVESWRRIKNGPNKRENAGANRLERDIERIFGYSRLEINATHGGDGLQVYVNNRGYRLEEMGAGLAQFILVFANAAIKDTDYILIDEPELSLHPTLQMAFLSALGSYARRGVLFATHSIGLARASAEDIYCLRSSPNLEGKTLRRLSELPRLAEFVGELGFSGYRELGFRTLLLVEGVTDVKTFQQFLRKYGHDHDVLVLQLGGSDMINGLREEELQELTRIDARIHAIIDSERVAPNAALAEPRNAFLEVCKRVGITCHILERRAIENYFTAGALVEVVGEAGVPLSPFEPLNGRWSKNTNWRIAQKMRRDDLDVTDLGRILSALDWSDESSGSSH